MNGDKSVTINFDKLGNTKMEANGFTGGTCVKATEVFEKAFNGKTGDRNLKPEYYDSNEASNTTTVQNGW